MRYAKIDEAGDFVDAHRLEFAHHLRAILHGAEKATSRKVSIEGVGDDELLVSSRQLVRVEARGEHPG